MESVEAAPVFSHGQQDTALSILADDVLLDRVPVAHVCDILDVNRSAVHHLDWDMIEASTTDGVPFMPTLYSVRPIFTVPDGKITF